MELGQIVVEKATFRHREDYLTVPPKTPVGPLPLGLGVELALSNDKRRGAIRVILNTDETQKPLYVLDISLVALIQAIRGHENMTVEQYATVNGAALLMPFLRELVANLTSRGRFGPVWLNPVNLAAAGIQPRSMRLPKGPGPKARAKPSHRRRSKTNE